MRRRLAGQEFGQVGRVTLVLRHGVQRSEANVGAGPET